MPVYHVFGSFWINLDVNRTFSERIEAESAGEAIDIARAKILNANHGLDGGELSASLD